MKTITDRRQFESTEWNALRAMLIASKLRKKLWTLWAHRVAPPKVPGQLSPVTTLGGLIIHKLSSQSDTLPSKWHRIIISKRKACSFFLVPIVLYPVFLTHYKTTGDRLHLLHVLCQHRFSFLPHLLQSSVEVAGRLKRISTAPKHEITKARNLKYHITHCASVYSKRVKHAWMLLVLFHKMLQQDFPIFVAVVLFPSLWPESPPSFQLQFCGHASQRPGNEREGATSP